jgi:predicted PurR-regulated permease PerM
VFFLTVIPFGSGLVWVPAVIWLATTGHSTSAVLLGVWCILIFPVLENVVRPYLVKRGSDLPALLILLGMLGGMSAFGFLGVFLGPALLALVYTLIEEWRAPAKRS